MGFWKNLAKIGSIAAPIAAAPFTGGATLALIGAGSGAAGGALSGGGWKGALMGAGLGAIPGVGKAISGAAGSGASTGGSLMSKLINGDTLLAAGKGLASIGQTSAHNRGVKLDAMMQGDQMKLLADQDRRAAESDFMRKMQQTSYLKGGGFKDPGTVTSASGQPLTKFDFGARPASESEIAMSTELEKQLMGRLRSPIQLSNYASQMDPGTAEKFMNWLGPAVSTFGVARGGGKYQGPNIPGAPTPTPQAPPVPPAPAANSGIPYDPNKDPIWYEGKN